MRGPFWTRLAAASGIGFAGVAVADYVIGSVKNLSSAADVATKASSSVWSTWVLLVALAGVLLLWFTATSAARLAEVEAGSARVAAEHRTAGTVIATLLFAEVAVQIAARGSSGTGLDALARAIVNGPVLAFAAGVYALAAGVVGTRAGAAIPTFSGVVARLSLLLGLALIAGGGLWLYRDYAWLNDTVFFAFVGFVFVRSVLGTFRWAHLDGDVVVAARRVRSPAPTTRIPRIEDVDEDTFEVPSIVRASRASRGRPKPRPARKAKPRARKAVTRKSAAPKPKPAAPKPKPAARKRAAAKRSPRKPAPSAPPPPAAEPEPLIEPDEEPGATETLDIFELEDEAGPEV